MSWTPNATWAGFKILVGILGLTQCIRTAIAEDFFPTHPTVVSMVDRGIEFLERADLKTNGMYQTGRPILIAYTIYKARADVEIPAVARGIEAAKRVFTSAGSDKIIYEAAFAGMLLSTVDAQKYRTECLAIRDFFVKSQRSYGAFGYLPGGPGDTGDTSQTQYAILALWTLDQHGIEVPIDVVERAANWLKSTQDPSGGWGYQGKMATSGLTAQTEVTHSLSAAGLCATLMSGDFLGFYRGKIAPVEDEDIPKAMKRVVERKEAERRKVTSMRREDLDTTIQLGSRWNTQREYVRPPDKSWHYYYRYSEERYESFLELQRGVREKNPVWYNRGVEDFRKLQSSTGGWGVDDQSRTHCIPDVATSFAILFLIRSTQTAIGALHEGVLAGGYELPKNSENITQVNGKIVDKAAVNSVDEILKMMENEGADKFDNAMVSDRLRLDADPKRRKEQLTRLTRLLSSSDWKARRSAAKLLARGDDLDVVPSLIFALSDTDSVVPKIAENSLRVISRQLMARSFPVNDETISDSQRKVAIAKWREWYLTVRPDYVFVD